jgi:hypothetical protein
MSFGSVCPLHIVREIIAYAGNLNPSVYRHFQFTKFPCISVVPEPYAENFGTCLIITFIGIT